jgi:hypothetical protein
MPELAWIVIAVLVAATVGGVLAVRKERKDPTSFTRRTDDLAWWGLLPAEEQEAYDTAALDLAEQAELDAVDGARESAAELVARAQINAQFHP